MVLEELINKVAEEKNKLVDKCTLKLLSKAGFYLRENYSNWDLVFTMDEMKKKGYEIKFTKSYHSKDWLSLIYKDKLIMAYEFDIRVDNNKIELICIPID